MSPSEETARFLTYHGLAMRHRADGLMEVHGQSKCQKLRTSKEHGTSCSIYQDRPAICSAFQCPKCK